MNEFFTFMVDWTLRSAVSVTLGFACVLLLRRRSAATRHLVWRLTLGAVALLPLVMALLPKAGTPVVMEPIQAPVRAVIRPLNSPRFDQAFHDTQVATPAATTDTDKLSPARVACWIYAAGLVVMFASWIAGYLKIRRIADGGLPVSGPGSPHRVLVATDSLLRVPITFGVFQPLIVLPKESEQWPKERVRAAILHESAHIARRDWAWQTGALLFRGLQWFNPAIWLLSASLQTTSETAADDEVLTHFGMGPSVYARELLKVAAAASGNLAAATAMARPGGVASRLRRIVAEGIERGRPRRWFVIGLTSIFGVAGILVSAGTVAEAAGKVAAEKGSHHEYSAKLSHGGIVRMVAMRQIGGDGTLWGPDGRPASQADRDLVKEFLDKSFGNVPGGRVVDFYLQVSKLPMKKGETENGIFRIVQPADGWQYRGGTNDSTGEGRLQWDQWSVPPNLRTFDMDCAIAYGPYKEIGHGNFGDGQFHQKIETQGDRTNVTLTIPGKYGQTQTELEIFDLDGKRIGQGFGPLEGRKDQESGDVAWDFSCSREVAKKMQPYALKIRRYEHVVIRGIRLPPTGVSPQ